MMEPDDSVTLHQRLWQVCRDQEGYRTGASTNNHELPDCSSGCRFFHPLSGDSGLDWGVCTNPKSPRAGLLTFEHDGCSGYEDKVDATTKIDSA